MSVKYSIRRFGFSIMAICLIICAPNVYAQDSPAALTSNNKHCISLDYIAGWMGIKVKTHNAGESVRLSNGKNTLVMDSGSIVATSGSKTILLSTCPILRDGVFYVPTKAVVRAFGGRATDTADGLQLDFAGKSTTVPYPAATQPASPIDKINADISDPRISLSSLAKTPVKSSRLWTYLNDFNAAASRVQPVLKAVSSSSALTFLSRIPVVGTPVSITQYTAHCLNASIQASQFLAKMHSQSDVPVRKAIEAVNLFQKSPSIDNVKSAVPAWKSAATALDKQLAQTDSTIALTQKMINAVTTVEDKVGDRLGRKAASEHVAGLTTFNRAARQYLLRLQGSKWEQSSLKSYFNRLADDGAKL
ncbi:MAG: stalk domain-containing protein [Armatimonadota bacterium]